jgi:AraC-like DNA-binding protein/FixJ family two-component response regulator
MTINEDLEARRQFTLATVAQRFLLRVLPFRAPAWRPALSTFVASARDCRTSVPQLDSVLLRCLAILDRHTGGILPSLVDRYLSDDRNLEDCLDTFSRCVESILEYEGVVDGRVQKAIAVIKANYGSHILSPRSIAAAAGVRLSTLCTVFKQQTGITLSTYIRDVRLQHATILLATTNRSIKEIWTAVGYNHASNFNHDFQARFGFSPSQYRERTIQPLAEERIIAIRTELRREVPKGNPVVLIVDDDDEVRDVLVTYLRSMSYRAIGANNGETGIRECLKVRPQVILLDYQLGDMTGLECLRAIRSCSAECKPAVALVTAQWNVCDLEEELSSLSCTVLLKPVELEKIEQCVRRFTSAESGEQAEETKRMERIHAM